MWPAQRRSNTPEVGRNDSSPVVVLHSSRISLHRSLFDLVSHPPPSLFVEGSHYSARREEKENPEATASATDGV